MTEREAHDLHEAIVRASEQWRQRPREERREILKRAGILDENGQLAARYRGEDGPYEPVPIPQR
jgi:acyl-CoA reductase-like NAD-dependent aldehyde dehydrogenase